MNLLQQLLEVRDTHADATALSSSDETWSYKQLYDKAADIAAQLPETEPQVIGIFADKSKPATYSAILATWLRGHAYTPLLAGLPERNSSVIDQTGLTVVLTNGEDTAGLPDHVQPIEIAGIPETSEHPAPAEVTADHLAYVLFTSGSTGVPKGVPITFKNLAAFADASFAFPGVDFRQDDRFLQMFELSFDLSVMCYLSPLLIGAQICLCDAKSIGFNGVLSALQKQKPTVALMVPSLIAYAQPLLKRMSLEELRYSFFCGEALVDEHVQNWCATAPNSRVFNFYGPTEATIYCLGYEWLAGSENANAAGIVSIGVPFAGVEAQLLDPDGKAVQAGESGELVVTGDQVFAGYWQNDAATQKAFAAPGVYRTGDSCSIAASGDHHFNGRIDFQVKIDGHRIELGEVEHHARNAGASQAIAIAHEITRGVHKLILFVHLEEPSADFEENLSAALPAYMHPYRTVTLDEFPVNTSGKVDRKALAALLD